MNELQSRLHKELADLITIDTRNVELLEVVRLRDATADAILDAVIEALPENGIGNAFSYNQAIKDITAILTASKSKQAGE